MMNSLCISFYFVRYITCEIILYNSQRWVEQWRKLETLFSLEYIESKSIMSDNWEMKIVKSDSVSQ